MFSFLHTKKENKWNLAQVAMLTFISLILISVITFFIYFNQVFKKFHMDSIHQEQSAMQKDMEAIRTSFPKLTIQILSDPAVSAVLADEQPDYEDVHSAVDTLQSLAFYNNVSQITIYDPKNDCVWLDRSMTPVPLEVYKSDYPEFEQVLEEFHRDGNYIIITHENNPHSDTPLNNITYAYQDYRGYILFFEYSQSDYSTLLLKGTRSNDYDTWIYYQGDKLILTNHVKMADIKADSGFVKRLENKKTDFTYKNMLYACSGTEDLQFITAVTYRDVLVNGLSTSAFFWLLFLAIAFFVFSYFRWFQSYSKRMLSRHRKDIDMTKKEMNSLVLKHLMINLINGKEVKKADISCLAKSFTNQYSRIIILHIDNIDHLLSDNSSDDIAIFKYGICNVACELLSLHGFCQSFDIDNDIATIILNSARPVEEETLREIVAEIKSLTSQIYTLTVTATISRSFSSLKNLAEGISDSLELSNYRYIIGYDSMILEADRPAGDMADKLPPTLFSQLSAATEQEDSQLVKAIIAEFCRLAENCTAISVRNQLLQMFLYVMQNKKSARLTSRDFETLLSFSTLREAAKYFEDAILKNADSKENDELDFVQLAEALTAENYANSDYHIGYIADRLQISISYAGKRFKNMFGRSFNSYLMEYRIEKAAGLLKNSNLKINEIAARCGFNSDTYFVTNFKKFKNMTPQAYRNSPK